MKGGSDSVGSQCGWIRLIMGNLEHLLMLGRSMMLVCGILCPFKGW